MLYAVNNWCVIKCAMGQGTSLMMLCKWTSSLMRFKAIQSKRKKTMSHLLIFSAKWLYFTDVMTLRVGIEVLIMCYHKQSVSLFSLIWTLKIFSSLSLIIVIMKVNHESMSPMFFVFLSQDICHIKIESEVSIWIVNLYWNRKKTWLS